MSKFLNSGLIKLFAPADENGAGGGGDAGAGAGSGDDAGRGDMYGAEGAVIDKGTKDEEVVEGAEGGEDGEEKTDDGLSDAERELMKEFDAEGKKAEDDKKVAPAVGSGAVKLDSESISQITNALKPAAPAGGAKEMDQAEVAKLLNPVVVSADTLKSLGFTEPTQEQVAGFQNFANATVKNAVSIARILIQNEAKKFEEYLGPISTHIQTQQAEGAKQEFFSTFPSLKQYDGIVKAAALEVSATKPDGSQKSRQEIFKEVAARAMRTLRSSNIQIGKTAPNANHSAGSGVVGKPNAFPGPGRSGGSSPTGGKNNADADIYSR